ncbi:hypothetical protein LPJ56_005503, partial [Coemansia sp. RSA 2599]
SPPQDNRVSQTSSMYSNQTSYEMSFQHQRLPQQGHPYLHYHHHHHYQHQPRLINIPSQSLHKPLPSPPSTTHMADVPSGNADVDVDGLQLHSMHLHGSQHSSKDAGWQHPAAGASNSVPSLEATEPQAAKAVAVASASRINPGLELGPMAVPAISGAASTASEGMLQNPVGKIQQPEPNAQSSEVSEGTYPLSPELDESVLTTYQYALRYAMLLDTDNLQLAARSRSVGSVGDAVVRTSTRSSASEAEGASFKVNSVSKATGAANLSNRTPTLVVHPGGRAGELLASKSNEDVGTISGVAPGAAKSKSWRTSLLVIGDSAARRLKAEISSAGKLKDLAKSKLGVSTSGNGSGSGGPAQTEPPSFRNPAAPKDGRITQSIVKALMQQLKKSAGAVALHQFTKDCYMDMYEELRSKASGSTMYEYSTVHDLIDSFSEIAHAVCERYNVTIKSDVSRTVDNQVSLFIKLLRTVLQSEAHTSRDAGIALLKLDDYIDTS